MDEAGGPEGALALQNQEMSNQMSAMGKTPPSKSTTAAAAPTSARAKTRGALLAGLRSGKLAKAVDAMDEAGGPEGALALQNQETAETKALGNKPQSARSKTRGALLAGLRNGKLAKAVDAMDSAGGPPSSKTGASSAKRNVALVPLRAGNGDVMAVQVRSETDRAGKVQETSVPIRSGNGDIMAVQLQKSVVQGVTVSDEGKFPRGDKIEPVVGKGGDLLAVRVSTTTEKDLSPKKGMVSVRDAQGSVMAVRVT
jgi:hypothetical protein